MAIKIVVATHGNFGKEIINSASMLVGDISKITSLSLMPGMSFEDFVNEARDSLNKNKDEIFLIEIAKRHLLYRCIFSRKILLHG